MIEPLHQNFVYRVPNADFAVFAVSASGGVRIHRTP